MSEALALVAGLTFRETLNLSCYSAIDPSRLTTSQTITRLYRFTSLLRCRNLLRSQLDTHWTNHNLRSSTYEFFDNIKKIKTDFEKMKKITDPDQFKYLKDKYEYMIYEKFDNEPYVRNLFEYIRFLTWTYTRSEKSNIP